MDILKAMQADAGIPIDELRVDGGATVNDLLMQFQADVLNTETVRPEIVETTVMGAAFLAGLAVGYWDDLDEIQKIWKVDRRFVPREDRSHIEQGILGWYRAIRALESWASDSETMAGS
jgi:glycerol kinase